MKLLQLPNPGNGGRLGNHLFTIASTIGLALRHGYTPRFPANWKYRERFNIPDEWFGEIEPAKVISETTYEYDGKIEYLLIEARAGIEDIITISLSGYLQSPKYWTFKEDEIRKYLTPKGAQPGTKDSAAIHYRRGDYVGNPNYYQLPMSYYLHAYQKHFDGWGIVAFSDDKEFIKLHHAGHWFHDDDPVSELAEMCSHKGHITANSTFSWWGAYLSGCFAVRPEEWFAGPLLFQCSGRDLLPPDWAMCEQGKADLKDVTFIIPVSYDHPDREENITYCLTELRRNFETNIIVGEINTNHFPAHMQFDYDGKFHRTKALNEMTKAADTPYVINLDADCFMPPFQVLQMVHRLRQGADMVYPYDGTFVNVKRSCLPALLQGQMTVLNKPGNARQVMNTTLPVINVVGSVGGCVGFNKERYMAIGGENENMISWSPEDVERYWRAAMFGLSIERIEGPIYHIDHYRGDNSNGRSEDSMNAHKYWEWLQQRTKEEVSEHLNLTRGYAGGWKEEDAIKEHAFSLELAYYISNLTQDYDTVLDLGCGPGFYAQFLKMRNHDVFAVDSGDLRHLSLFSFIFKEDILLIEMEPCNVVLCLEVGEHVPQEDEQRLIDQICKHATDLIILSWAIPGQGGFGHVNCQPNAYIVGQMKARGWNLNANSSNLLRQHCSGATWFEDTIMVFEK
jgi:SAM-dependent methyltransferase